MLGVLYFCDILFRLSGLLPFAGENEKETLQNVSHSHWDFDSEAFSGISYHAKDFIKKLLIRKPECVSFCSFVELTTHSFCILKVLKRYIYIKQPTDI